MKISIPDNLEQTHEWLETAFDRFWPHFITFLAYLGGWKIGELIIMAYDAWKA